MIAFDTNLLVRLVVADNPEQVAIIQQLIEQDSIFISRTALLETEWVLRSVYKKSRGDVLYFFKALLDVDNTELEDALAIKHALEWYALGSDFADALHLAVCGNALMHTFDKKFCKSAREANLAPPVNVLISSSIV